MMEGRHSVRDPKTVMGGQYSLPFTVAVAALCDMSNPLSYDDATINDPTVRELAQRIELISVEVAHAAAATFNPEVLIDLDGQSYTLATGPYKGSARNPFTWDDIREKFTRYAGTVLDSAQVSDIIDVVGDLENVSGMSKLAGLVSARSGALSGR
jgi:2-methylcitrate dehydratase PrpD